MHGSLHAAEQLVAGIPDVRRCRIETDPAGDLLGIEVVTHGARAVEDVRAEVVARLATLGVDVLEEQVQVQPEREPQPASEDLETLEVEVRVRLAGIRTQVTSERNVAEVDLLFGDATIIGHAETRGAASAPDLLAQAVLDALERLCGGRVTLRLVGLRRMAVGEQDVVTVVVQESAGREVRFQVGAARMQDDLARAAADAALAAMNRRLGRILAVPGRTYRIG